MMIALAPFSTTISERMKAELGLSLPAANTRWIGRLSAAPSAIRITAPSPISAVLSATATSSVAMVLPTWAATKRIALGEGIGHRADAEARLRRKIGQFRHEGAIDNHQPAAVEAGKHLPGRLAVLLGRRIGRRRQADKTRASARADRCISSASTRRCGRPPASKRLNASSRSAATAPLPGSVPRAPANRRRERLLGRGLDGADFDVHGAHAASPAYCA